MSNYEHDEQALITKILGPCQLPLAESMVKQLRDQESLLFIYHNTSNIGIQCSAVKRICDQDKLFEIAQSSVESIACSAVRNITNQDMLFKIAKIGRGAVIREALKRIIDTDLLMEIAFDAKFDFDIRLHATNQICDEKTRKEVLEILEPSPAEKTQYNSDIRSGM